ncbi:hypothetical protein BGZ83_002194 [Gryganskiella cystojenkinii]|nr:hypothetical protein BGZ83_002194 [Gryganskiella cystojenkinii]
MSSVTATAAAAVNASKRLLDVWFRDFVPGQPFPGELFRFWFSGAKEVDDLLRDEFAQDVERALIDVEFRNIMKQSGEGTLALTILLDQIPRNIFRGSARPFVEFDPLAREVVKDALARQSCLHLHPIYRHVLYMPFEHSEDLNDQATAVAEFSRELKEVDSLYKDMFHSWIEYALKHEATIKKFGRFPHRNQVLGRISTEAERVYLVSGGDRWGQ